MYEHVCVQLEEELEPLKAQKRDEALADVEAEVNSAVAAKHREMKEVDKDLAERRWACGHVVHSCSTHVMIYNMEGRTWCKWPGANGKSSCPGSRIRRIYCCQLPLMTDEGSAASLFVSQYLMVWDMSHHT